MDGMRDKAFAAEFAFGFRSSVYLHGRMLKMLSVVGYFVMAGGLLGLLITRSLLSASPLVLSGFSPGQTSGTSLTYIAMLAWAYSRLLK